MEYFNGVRLIRGVKASSSPRTVSGQDKKTAGQQKGPKDPKPACIACGEHTAFLNRLTPCYLWYSVRFSAQMIAFELDNRVQVNGYH